MGRRFSHIPLTPILLLQKRGKASDRATGMGEFSLSKSLYEPSGFSSDSPEW